MVLKKIKITITKDNIQHLQEYSGTNVRYMGFTNGGYLSRNRQTKATTMAQRVPIVLETNVQQKETKTA